MISFFVSEILKFFYYANLVIDDAIGFASTVARHKIKNISANNEAMLLIETWQGCCTLQNIPEDIMLHILMLLWQRCMLGSSLLPLQN